MPWSINPSNQYEDIEEIKKSTVGFYQSNTCKFSFAEVFGKNISNTNLQYIPDLYSSIKCSNKINGVDYFEEATKVYIGTNLNLDFIFQSLFWILLIYFIPKSKENLNLKNISLPTIFLIGIFYLHLLGEKDYYNTFSKEFDTKLSIENFFLLSLLISLFLILNFSSQLIEKRFYNLINYSPFLFLFVGAYNSFNLNFFLLILVFIGIVALMNMNYLRNKRVKYFTSIYGIFSTIYLINFDLNTKPILFDVDKLKGFSNSSNSLESLIFWILIFYLLIVGIMFLISESKSFIKYKLLKFNFLLTGSLVLFVGYASALSPAINFFSYFYLGLNKAGMRSFDTVESNAWRGISPSAEGIGEFYAFVILFTALLLIIKKQQITKIELFLLLVNIVGLLRSNNFAAIISLILVLTLTMLFLSRSKYKIFYYLMIVVVILSTVFIVNPYSYNYLSKAMLYNGAAATEFSNELAKNEWGLSAVEKMSFGELLENRESSGDLSTSLRFLLSKYTYSSIDNLPNWVSVISVVSVPINRSEKWGIFFAKYNPNTIEFIFGQGPNQLANYYKGHDTKFNYGLVLPHSSFFDYLIFFGISGLLILGIYTLKQIILYKKNYLFIFPMLFLALNLLKSDSLLYFNNFFLVLLFFNFYKLEEDNEK